MSDKDSDQSKDTYKMNVAFDRFLDKVPLIGKEDNDLLAQKCDVRARLPVADVTYKYEASPLTCRAVKEVIAERKK